MIQEIRVNSWNQAAESLKQRAEGYMVYKVSVAASEIKWEGGWEGQVTGNSGKAVSAAAACESHQEGEQKSVESHPDLTAYGVKIKGCTCSTELGGVGEGS